ncbi:MAG: hypothetical protein K0S12_433 [Bacteroidetes bacterium]|nr:hypothetical protein [Bacteroidota bacterium]
MKKITVLALALFFISNTFAQVKIGNNPNTINVNSMLELESTNKGFLPPRVALSSVITTSPLTSTTPAGMMVYSSGGAVADGYYNWNGTKWVTFAGSERSNYVLVKSASDFPAAVGGVITLAANTLYEINGTISLSNMINLNGSTIRGGDAVNDRLVYTGSGELFTGANGGTIRFVSLIATGGKIFNLNAGGAVKNLVVQNCYIVSSLNVGSVQGFGGTVYFQTIAYQNNYNGITFQDDFNVVIAFSLWDSNNKGTYEKFIGSFNLIQIIGGDRLTSVLNGVVALDISAVTSVNAASCKTVMFLGNATYVNGSFTNAWEVEAFGIDTQNDEVAAGNIYLTASAITTFAGSNQSTKILGTTTAANLFRASSPQSNRLTYTGNKTRRFQVVGSMSFSAQSSNRNFSFYIVKNGVVVQESRQTLRLNTGADKGSITLSCNVPMSTNDYIEVWVENNSDNSGITVESFNLSIK